MGGKRRPGRDRAVVVAVDDPNRAPEVAAFLQRVDYDTTPVDSGSIEAVPPDAWPDRLALAALEHFLTAWRRAHPGVGVRIEDRGPLAE